MFTGIIEELGEVVAIESLGSALGDGRAGGSAARLRVRGPLVTEDAAHGDSIAVNGVCLTVAEFGGGEFTADVMGETLRATALGALTPGSRVNLERPRPLDGRLGGHLVQGHVDGTGTIAARTPGEHWESVTITLPPALARYVVDKGSITVDGVSLTVVAAGDDRFGVGLIPTTLALTTLGLKAVGDPVNLEVDVVAKYVERLLGAAGTAAGPRAEDCAGAGAGDTEHTDRAPAGRENDGEEARDVRDKRLVQG